MEKEIVDSVAACFTNEFALNLVSGGVVGIFASYAASIFFLKNNNKNHRPVIKISDKLIKNKRSDGTPSLLIKIINMTNEDISDVLFTVDGIENLSPSGSIPLYKLTALSSREILYIKKYSKNDSDAHFAHRTNLYNNSFDITTRCCDFEKIRVSIKASCPYYGTSVVVSRDYDIHNDILNSNHSFNTGDSLSITAH